MITPGAGDISFSGSNVDPYWWTVVLAMHFDGTNGSTSFIDLKGNSFTVQGTSQISTAQSKFGGASGYFSSGGITTANRLVGPVSSNWVPPSAFTIECWLYMTSYPSNSGRILSSCVSEATWNSTGVEYLFEQTASGVKFSWWNGVTNGFNYVGAGVGLNAWYHIAIVLSGGTTIIYKNGVSQNTNSAAYSIPTGTPTLEIGGIYGESNSSTVGLVGYIDDLRITNGIARYTSNFTPSTWPFPNS